MELQAEIAQAWAFRANALGATGVIVPPKSTLFDVSDAGFGYRTSKVQKQVLDEVRGARLIALENLASNLLPDDLGRKAFEKGHKDKCSKSLLDGVPLSSTRFSS